MVLGRGGPSAEAEENRESALVRGDKVILEAISREKFWRNTGILEYESQQESRLQVTL